MADWDSDEDSGWGDDPFEGDLDFDSDFDGAGKQGFLKSFVSGFLGGVVDQTVGDTDARIKTLKMALPGSFTGAFTNLRDLNDRRRELFKDVKSESFTAVQDLQYLAKRAGDRLSKSTPNKISGMLTRFSEHDFSSWEKTSSSSSSSNPAMEAINEEDVNTLVNNEDANTNLIRDTATKVGKETLSMLSEIGGRTIGQQAAMGQALTRTNNLLQQMLDHQRRVQARTDAMQLNILARTYLTNAKFYKFMEVGVHRQIDELKEIRRFAEMSDYEKTSNSQAVRKSIRDSVFNTVKSKFGGIGEFITDKFGKDSQNDAIGGVGGALSGIRMALTMAEGMPINYGNMAGGAAATWFISSLPKLIKSGRAQGYLNQFKQKFPTFSARVEKAYAKLTDAGHSVTYATGNVEELANSLVTHSNGGMAFNVHEDYEEYKASLPPTQKPMSRTRWEILSRVKKVANAGLDTVLNDTYHSTGTTFHLQQRKLSDGHEQSMWNRRSDRTLNEEIPRWLGEIWASLEKNRTGRDDIKPLTYDYTKAKFLSHNQKLAKVVNTIYDKNQFAYQAGAALNLVENIDKGKALKPKEKDLLAYHLTRQADAKKGFNPYNFLNLEDQEGVSEKDALTIRKLMMREFGITDEHITKFKEGTHVDRLEQMAVMPTKEGRKRLVDLADSAKSMSRFTPDITNALDVMKSSGYYDAMVETGIIKRSPSGQDEINQEEFWKVYKKFINDPKSLAASVPGDLKPLLNRKHQDPLGRLKTPKITIKNQPTDSGEMTKGLTELGKTVSEGFSGLKETLEKTVGSMGTHLNAGLPPAAKVNFAPVTRGINKLNKTVETLVTLATARNATLDALLARQPKAKTETPADDAEAAKAKRSIIDRLRASNLREMFNNGVDKLLDQEPLILGGMLGALGAVAFHNPKAAALLAGGAAAAVVYTNIKHLVMVRNALDNEDLYEEGASVPILEAFKLHRGDYLDMATRVVITTWSSIVGSVYDGVEKVVIGARKLAGKLFTKENKEVFLKGLNQVREALMKVWKVLDPMTRIGKMKDAVVGRFTSMDVYKEGEKSPTLTRSGFKTQAYYKRDAAGQFVAIKGWNEIDGPVYDKQGNVIITQEDYDRGLKTSMGISINKLGAAGRRLSKFGLDMMGKVKEKLWPHLVTAKDKVVAMVSADYSPIVSSVDRIYDLLVKHWGYDQEDHQDEPSHQKETSQPEETPKTKAPSKEPVKVKETPEKVAADKTKKQKERGEKRAEEEKEAAMAKHSTFDKLKETMGIKKKTPPPIPKVPPVPKAAAPKVSPKPKVTPKVASKAKPKATPKVPSPKPVVNAKGKTEDPNGERLNSLENQAKRKREKLKTDSEEAEIRIADGLGTGLGEGGKNEKRKGLFSLLFSGLGAIAGGIFGISKFFTTTLWSSLKTLTSFATMGLKLIPTIASGIGMIAKAIFTLVKTRSIGQAAGGLMDDIRGKKSKRQLAKDRLTRMRGKTTGGRIRSGGLKVGGAMALGYATDALTSSGLIEPGGTADKVLGVAGDVGTGLGIAEMLGADVSMGAVAGVASTALVAMWGLAAPILMNPYVLAGVAIAATGYGIYRYVTRGSGKQLELRMVQYGVGDASSDLAKKILQAEEMLTKYVVIGNAKASFSKEAPLQKVLQLFISDPRSQREAGDVFSWFNGRFKPVFLTYMACLDAAKMKSFKDYDESKSQDVYSIAKQVNTTLGSVQPFPYSIVAKIDPDQRLLPEKTTIIKVNNLLEELKAYIDRKSPGETSTVAMPGSEGTLTKEKAVLEAQIADPKKAFGNNWSAIPKQFAAIDRLKVVDSQLDALNGKFGITKAVKDIYIDDLLPDNRSVDMLTGIRLACYGNSDDWTWRIEAVLKLERYCESLFTGSGDSLTFKGQAGDLFGMFQASFQLTKDDGEMWCLWFRDRFMPVMTNYFKLVNQYRKGNPGVVWKSLSVTARYEIAKSLVDTKVSVGALSVSIWKVRASPFKDSVSPDKADRVDRMVGILAQATTQAKIKDPEAEAGATNVSTWAKAIAPHKVGGGISKHAANVQTAAQAKTKDDVALGGQFGTNTNRGAGTGNTYTAAGLYGAAPNTFSFKALSGDSDTSHLDMTGVKKNGTEKEDKGVSIPQKTAEQLIIRTMLKAGFTDPRQIAEMLALTNYESNGYKRTTESLSYKDPNRLVKLFKEIKTTEQAKQLIAQGEEAIANAVYGGKKGADLGNRNPGDGWKYRGRGLVQLTGAHNYAKFGKALGIDLINHPELASNDPNVMAEIAVQFFKDSKMLQSIGSGADFTQSALGLNGGNALPGMDQRKSLYDNYLKQLQSGDMKAGDAPADGTAAPGTPGASGTPASAGGSGGGGGTPSSSMGTPSGVDVASKTPALGSGAVPSPNALPGGGSGTGAATPSTPAGGSANSSGAGESLVKSSGTSSGGLRLKAGEATAGGDSHPGIKRLAQLIQQKVQNFRYFSALNDAFHKREKPNSKHAQGLAIDFTLTNGIGGSDAAVGVVKEILGQAGMAPNEYLVINEYRNASAKATGGHVHTQFASPAAADKFAKASGANDKNGQDPTSGDAGGLQDNGLPPAPPSAVDTQSAAAAAASNSGGDTTTGAAPNGGNAGNASDGLPPMGTQVSGPSTPSAPQSPASAPSGGGSPAPAASSQAAPNPPATSSPELAALLAKLNDAVSQSGSTEAQLLKSISDQLGQLIQVTQKSNTPPQKTVNMGG